MIHHQSLKVTDIVARARFFAHLLQATVWLPACPTPMARDRQLFEAQLGTLLNLDRRHHYKDAAVITKFVVYNDLTIYGSVNFSDQMM